MYGAFINGKIRCVESDNQRYLVRLADVDQKALLRPSNLTRPHSASVFDGEPLYIHK
jgi:hypothetical protein